ncbi:related to UTR2 - cell wall protein [Melanopsichium pennsylvanicum]|uniref:Related to UTR2 - cell wall protein n=2 Tax=Melanopsichium pennsylvanicum TaxID=63383 RepID=A0AAJ5C2K6_9BASI|nr:related to UTR2-cell wall protein [Melanopsichium pennsylvanicum 4]SNX81643.1 related to UTR2 - cell wall protein [Melanopsichium pennsylvanicum]
MVSQRFTTLLLSLVASLTILTINVSAQGQCSSTSKCAQASPCCSSYGFCGSTSDFCLGTCDPTSSYKPSSCKPMPKCKPITVNFDNNNKPYIPFSSYRGDPNQAPFTLDQGSVESVKSGTKMLLTKDGVAKQGTLLSSTRYWYYGQASAVMKHSSWAGVVNTFIGMSQTKDEIDWEFVKSDQDVETNYYWTGDPEGYTHGFTVPNSTLNSISQPRFSANDWHTYTIDWSPNRLRWLIDGTIVRTLYRKNTFNKNDGLYHYPSSPMRLQLSIWGAGDGTFPQGTVDWAGGLIDWSKAPNGRFVNMVKTVTITCQDPADVQDERPNYAFSVKQTNNLNGQPQVLTTSRSSIIS